MSEENEFKSIIAQVDADFAGAGRPDSGGTKYYQPWIVFVGVIYAAYI